MIGNGVDLHIHTCYSDGVLRPEEVVDRWQAEGYSLIAITDHDGILGSLIACDYAVKKNRKNKISKLKNNIKGIFSKNKRGNLADNDHEFINKDDGIIKIVPGIEFDSCDELSKEIHMLGYGIDLYDQNLRMTISKVNQRRARRNDKMLKIINDLGYDITIDDVIDANFDTPFIGKPTFARALANKGYFETPNETFSKLFEVNKDLKELQKETLTTEQVIRVIHAAGGVAVMAHPMEQRKKGETRNEFFPRLEAMMDTLLRYGLDGIECYHPSATSEDSEFLYKYASEHNLLVTRGSDYHSDNKRVYMLD